MARFTIKWHKTTLSALDTNDDYYFYAFSRGSNLLYIGNSIRQDVKDRIPQNIRRFNLDPRGLTIWLGEISDTSYQRITKQMILDTEALLINSNQPNLNTQCKANYNGRGNLTVECLDMPLLLTLIKS
jgi:hypothetical protein